MIEITDTHIAEFESRFEGLSFDDESKEFIKCLESKDIKACPGAGKTTSLVAKLDIIAKQMPFKDNSGILVLTHTNVAVDEIKAKLGANAKILLSYPNHVGTFQSFVNKYLAIPMYVKLFGKRAERIDSEIFNDKLLKKLNKYYLNNFIPQSAQTNNFTSLESFIKALIVEDSKIVLPQSGGRKKTIVNNGKPSYQNIKKAKEENIIMQVIQDGYLTYQHCYKLALKYLDDFPNMKEVFQKRFKYVFIDEVQDTDDRQFEILDKLFSNSDVVVQRIGDKNQEIFSSIKSEASGWIVSSDNLEIKNTKRLSSKISEKVTHFAISPQELNGNSDIELQPVILLFDKDSMSETVLVEFGKLIEEHELYNAGNKIFKAVGAVKSHDTKYGISAYYPSFTQTDNTSLEQNTLLEKFDLFDKKNILAKDYRKVLLSIIVEYLKLENIKNVDSFFTKTTLLKYLKESDKEVYADFKLKLFEGVQLLNSGQCSYEMLKEKIQKILDMFTKSLNEPILQNIIKNYKLDFTHKTDKNKYKHSNGEIEFDISVSTIHKVKGETHTATLLLETFNRTYDLKQLLDLLKGNTIGSSNAIDAKKKLLYVAMSRPTHLLCLAMNKEHVNDGDKSELERCGYIINDITYL